MVTLETKRLLLRPWREEDAPALFRYASDPQVGLSAGWKPHASVEESREIIRTVLSEPDTFAVILRETGEPVGSVGVFPTALPEGKGESEIGYWIGPALLGPGTDPGGRPGAAALVLPGSGREPALVRPLPGE